MSETNNNLSGPTLMGRPGGTPKRAEIKPHSDVNTAPTHDVLDDINDILDFGSSSDADLSFDSDTSSTNSYEYTPEPEPVYTQAPAKKKSNGAWERTIHFTSDKIFTENKGSNKKENVLYIILDKPIDGVLNYFRSYGVNVSRVFNDIKSAKSQILMQVDPTDIIIIDSGTGEFASTAARKEIIDLIGLCDEENTAEIFYCDDLLKSEIQYNEVLKQSKVTVSWTKFKSIAMVLAYLLEKKKFVNYIKDSSYGSASDIYTNLCITLEKNTDEVIDKNESPDTITLNTSDVIANIKAKGNGYDLIEGFKTILKS